MPARARLIRPLGLLAAPCLVAAVAGCGALPPQAPVQAASTISSALTTIASSCGESYRLQEFTVHPDVSGLDRTAGQSAEKLARIAARHPRWVYQGKTLTQLATLSRDALDGCSLTQAADVLRRVV